MPFTKTASRIGWLKRNIVHPFSLLSIRLYENGCRQSRQNDSLGVGQYHECQCHISLSRWIMINDVCNAWIKRIISSSTWQSHSRTEQSTDCSFKLLASLFILYDILLLATPEVLSTVLNSYAQCSLFIFQYSNLIGLSRKIQTQSSPTLHEQKR